MNATASPGLWDRFAKVVSRHRAGRALLLMIDVLDEHNAMVAAAAMAFDAFLSLVPLAAFAGMVMHRLNESGDVVLGGLFRQAPRPVAELVAASLGRLTDSDTAVAAPLSIAAFLWTTSAGISTAMLVFEKMFHSPPRPWWWRRAIAILSVLASVAILSTVTAITVSVGIFSARAGAFVAFLVPGATLTGLLVAFFRIAIRQVPVPPGVLLTPMPTPSVRKRRTVGAGVAVTLVLWFSVSGLFSYYVATIARYATLYGQLAAVAIFMFWLWLLALSLLVGGEVNAQIDGLRDHRVGHDEG